VDILEPIHLIVCNSNKGAHSVLFPEKILQIIGRARVPAHSYNLISFRKLTNPFIKSQFPFINRKDLLEEVQSKKKDIEKISITLNEISDENMVASIKSGILNSKVEVIKGLFRLDRNGDITISDFTADYHIFNSKRAREYEKNLKPLLDYLSDLFNIERKELYISQFRELSSLTSHDLIEAFLDSYGLRILKTSQSFKRKHSNTSFFTLIEAEDNFKSKDVASLLLQVIYFKYLFGEDSFRNKIEEYNSKTIVISKFARTLKVFKFKESKFFEKYILPKIKLNEEYTVDNLKVIFYDLFAEENSLDDNHISDFISLDMIENDLKFSELLNDLFIVKKRRKGQKKETVYLISSYDSSTFTSKVVRNSFKDELDRKLGVDDKSILLNVSNELLDSMIS
jgi:hypothetical protein